MFAGHGLSVSIHINNFLWGLTFIRLNSKLSQWLSINRMNSFWILLEREKLGEICSQQASSSSINGCIVYCLELLGHFLLWMRMTRELCIPATNCLRGLTQGVWQLLHLQTRSQNKKVFLSLSDAKCNKKPFCCNVIKRKLGAGCILFVLYHNISYNIIGSYQSIA